MSALIYLVDDNVRWRSAFKEYLENRFYDVLEAGDGGDVTLQHLIEADPTVVVLDGALPGRNGFEVCRFLRQHPRFGQKGIIMVSGQYTENADQIVGYEFGADIYQIKPADSRLLLAQIKRLENKTKNSSGSSDWAYIDTHLRVSSTRKEVQKSGKRLKFAPLEFELLELLAKSPNIPVNRKMISDKLGIADEQITKLVAAIRKKIGAKYIRTHHRIGYSLDIKEEEELEE